MHMCETFSQLVFRESLHLSCSATPHTIYTLLSPNVYICTAPFKLLLLLLLFLCRDFRRGVVRWRRKLWWRVWRRGEWRWLHHSLPLYCMGYIVDDVIIQRTRRGKERQRKGRLISWTRLTRRLWFWGEPSTSQSCPGLSLPLSLSLSLCFSFCLYIHTISLSLSLHLSFSHSASTYTLSLSLLFLSPFNFDSLFCSLDYEECAHKLLKTKEDGQEVMIPHTSPILHV